MSRIDDLIKQYAPDGVEYVSLGDVATTVSGLTGKSKADFTDGNVRFVSYKNVFANLAVDQSALDFVKVAAGERQNQLRLGDVVFTGSSESTEEVGMSAVVMTEPTEPLYLNSFCFAVRFERGNLFEPGFSKYLFRSDGVRRQIQRAASGVTRINVSKPRFMKTRVPVPPLEVQREIVRILDAFTALEAELEAERRLRREQRAAVINNEFVALAQTERVPLGELATQFVEPLRVEPDQEYINLGVKWYGEGAFAREAKFGREIKGKTLYKVRSGQFIYNRMFVTEGSFGVVTPDIAHGVVSNEFPVFELDASRILPEWLYLKFRDPYVVSVVAGQASGGTKSRRRWREDQFRAFSIDLPSLEDQREMVRVHNQFLGLESAITAELEGRRHQFAYYRDRLLSFEEAD